MYLTLPVDHVMLTCFVTMAFLQDKPVRRSVRKPVNRYQAFVNGVHAHILEVAPRACVLKCPATSEGRFRRPSRSGFPSQTSFHRAANVDASRVEPRAGCLVRCGARKIEPVSRKRVVVRGHCFRGGLSQPHTRSLIRLALTMKGWGAPASCCLREAADSRPLARRDYGALGFLRPCTVEYHH